MKYVIVDKDNNLIENLVFKDITNALAIANFINNPVDEETKVINMFAYLYSKYGKVEVVRVMK